MTSFAGPPIDDRKQSILKAVVTDYVRTAEPVGSESLLQRHRFHVRSATIRSELAELSDMGYLHQPHISAGRIPSELGYRFYVDKLIDAIGLPRSEAAAARSRLSPRRAEVDIVIEQTCRVLADLARYTSLATRPAARNARVRHVGVANVSRGKMLAVVVLDNGQVLHGLLEVDSASRKPDPVAATNYLSAVLAGSTLESAASGPPNDDHANPALAHLLEQVRHVIGCELDPAGAGDVCVEGASYIVKQPEFRDPRRLEAVLEALEERAAIYRLLSSAYLGPGVTVLIGSENTIVRTGDCSLVGARYHIGGRPVGAIAVVGPTRMDYRRAMGAVEFMADNLSRILSQLSGA